MYWVSIKKGGKIQKMKSKLPLFAVPPEIDDLKTSSDVHVNEGDEATLECHANGHPKPDIKWLREDKENFTVYDKQNKRMIGKKSSNSIIMKALVSTFSLYTWLYFFVKWLVSMWLESNDW